MGGAEEPNSIWRGQGICKVDEISGTDRDTSLCGAKGVGFLMDTTQFPLKDNERSLLPLASELLGCREISAALISSFT